MKVLLNHSILIFIGLLLSASLTAQESKIDSLESVLKQKIHDTVRIQVVFELASEFKDKDINKSIAYSNQLLSLSQKRNDKTNMSKAYDLLALGLYQKDYQIDTVIAVYKKSLDLANAVNNTGLKLKALSGMARTYGKFGLKDKAISLHQEVLKKAEATNDKLTIITASCDLGNLLRYQKGAAQLAKKYYFKALKYSEELNEQDFILINKGAIAAIYHIEGKLDSALTLAKEVLKQSEEMNLIESQITMLNGIGII
jgi:tetratricopeptide (TPR) repeat protein